MLVHVPRILDLDWWDVPPWQPWIHRHQVECVACQQLVASGAACDLRCRTVTGGSRCKMCPGFSYVCWNTPGCRFVVFGLERCVALTKVDSYPYCFFLGVSKPLLSVSEMLELISGILGHLGLQEHRLLCLWLLFFPYFSAKFDASSQPSSSLVPHRCLL